MMKVNKEVFVKHSNKKEYKYFVIKVKFYLRFDKQSFDRIKKTSRCCNFRPENLQHRLTVDPHLTS